MAPDLLGARVARWVFRISNPVDGRCAMCHTTVDDCGRYHTQCLGHVARAARHAGTGAMLNLVDQFERALGMLETK